MTTNHPNYVPRHIGIVMDGNGRWAKARHRPRSFGHNAGRKAVREVVEGCLRHGVEALTLFAFSSENWQRPQDEVGALLDLFVRALDKEVDELHSNGVRLRFIGELAAFEAPLQKGMLDAMKRTEHNGKLQMNVAVNYGGRWDIVQAAQQMARQCASGALRAEDISEARFGSALALAGLPEADLLIRTGAEQRLSNFLLWDLAYAELYFSAQLWPDFSVRDLEDAFAFFAGRERRFGQTGSQRDVAKA
jgi:undecaprenyl diphosphate synthase